MNIACPHLPLAILIGVIATYAFALWWFLKGEGVWSSLGCIAALSVVLRLYSADTRPPGLDIDEIKNLGGSVVDYAPGRLFGETSTGIPKLIPVVFHVPLEPYLGARWAIRLYSFLGMTLSVAMMFALARALGLDKPAAFAGAGLVAVLPWSLFYGSVWQGGELVLNQLLLLTVLARILSAESRRPDVWIGGVALCLAFYTYFSSRSMLPMPLVVLALRPSRRSADPCLSILGLAFLGWIPFLLNPENKWTFVGLGALQLNPEIAADYTQLIERLMWTLRAFYEPVASGSENNLLSAPYAAMHPPFVLALAVIGLMALDRRGSLFVLAAFLCALAPAVLSTGLLTPSSHRLIQSYPLIALAAAAGLNALRVPGLAMGTAVASVALAALFGIKIYFADAFWDNATMSFLKESSWLAEQLPRSDKLVVAHQVPYLDMYRGMATRQRRFTQESWFPRMPALYAFGPRALALRPLYEDIVGPDRVRTVGQAFWIDFTAAIDRPPNAGWVYHLSCGAAAVSIIVPVVYDFPWVRSPRAQCVNQPAVVSYAGRWVGPSMSLRLYTNQAATIEVGEAVYHAQGVDQSTVFAVEPDTIIRIRVEGPDAAAMLYRGDDTQQLPYWRWVVPVDGLARTSKDS